MLIVGGTIRFGRPAIGPLPRRAGRSEEFTTRLNPVGAFRRLLVESQLSTFVSSQVPGSPCATRNSVG